MSDEHEPEHGQPAHVCQDSHKWVVMIYMATTSPQLCAAMERDLKELNLRLGNLGEDIYVVVQADTPDGQYVTRQRLLGGERVQNLPAFCPRSDGGASAKEKFLSDFIWWRFHGEPKRFGRTLLVLWGHAQGIAAALSQPGSPAFAMVGSGGFGFDPLLGDALTLPQIRCAIEAGLTSHEDCSSRHRIDLLSFDSCFMSAVEAAVELQQLPSEHNPYAKHCQDRDLCVDFLLAAQTAILLDGLDYSRLADAFVPKPCIEPKDLGRRLLSQAAFGNDSPTSLSLITLKAQAPSDAKGTVSALKNSSSDFEWHFARLVAQLSRVLGLPVPAACAHTDAGADAYTHGSAPTSKPNRAEWLRIRYAFEAATWHRVRQFVDIGDLCRRLINNCRDQALRSAAWKVLDEVRAENPDPKSAQDHRFLIDVRSAHPLILSGLSLYCPWLFPTPAETRAGAWNAVVDLKDYRHLRFPYCTGWGEFIHHAKQLLEESRQRAINAELEDLRRGIRRAARGLVDPVFKEDFGSYRLDTPKPTGDRFEAAEPRVGVAPLRDRYVDEGPPHQPDHGGNVGEVRFKERSLLTGRAPLLAAFDESTAGGKKPIPVD